MATKSILKNISIKDNASARHLADALEHANEKRERAVEINHVVSEASREDIQRMFSRKQ